MLKLSALSIKATFTLISASMVATIAMVALAVGFYFLAEEKMTHTLEQKYESYLLADEFRQGSDDLTRLARTYVVTANPQYQQEYNDIIAVRNGEKPRADGETISLTDLMHRAGFSQAEFDALERAKAESDALAQLETEAMTAIESGATPAERDAAITLLHADEYHGLKAKIMVPVDEFFTALETRIQANVAGAAQQVFVTRSAMLVAGLLLLAMQSPPRS